MQMENPCHILSRVINWFYITYHRHIITLIPSFVKPLSKYFLASLLIYFMNYSTKVLMCIFCTLLPITCLEDHTSYDSGFQIQSSKTKKTPLDGLVRAKSKGVKGRTIESNRVGSNKGFLGLPVRLLL